METLPTSIAPYLSLLTGRDAPQSLRRGNISPGMYLLFHFEHDDDAKSAAIVVRDLARRMRECADMTNGVQAKLFARLEMARAQQRLDQGVQYRQPERRQEERRGWRS